MKKLIFTLSILAVLVSCSKEEPEALVPTDVTGTTTISGIVSKNVVTQNNGNWITSNRIPAEGVEIQVRVNKNSLHPGSQARGFDTYTATTDAQGQYSVEVKTNAQGVQAEFTVKSFVATLDTIFNGATRQGPLASYNGINQTLTLRAGIDQSRDHNITASVITNDLSNLPLGTAVVRGVITRQIVREEELAGGGTNISNINVPASGVTVFLDFNKDPSSNSTKTYTATTNAQGQYSFSLPTVNLGTTGFSQNAILRLPDLNATRDTLKVLAIGTETTVTGPAGVYNGSTNFSNQNDLFSTEVRNAVNFNFSSFTEN